jgi:hypothetical protein
VTLVLTIFAGPAPTLQDPTVEAMVGQLNRGRLVLERAPFKSSDDHLAEGSEALLQQTARALGRTEGRFVVFVAAEQDRSLPPDTVLSRRRTAVALQRLIAAGSNPNRLMLSGIVGAPVGTGRARIELVKVE